MADPELQREAAPRVIDRLVQRSPEASALVRVHAVEPLARAHADLFSAPAQHLLPPVGVVHRAAREVPLPEAIVRAAGGEPIPGLGGLEHALRLLTRQQLLVHPSAVLAEHDHRNAQHDGGRQSSPLDRERRNRAGGPPGQGRMVHHQEGRHGEPEARAARPGRGHSRENREGRNGHAQHTQQGPLQKQHPAGHGSDSKRDGWVHVPPSPSLPVRTTSARAAARADASVSCWLSAGGGAPGAHPESGRAARRRPERRHR